MNGYDKIYSQHPHFFNSRTRLIDCILLLITPGGRLLDLGVGQGDMALELAQKGGFSEVIGVDNSQVGLDQFMMLAKEKSVNVKAICSDLCDFVFEGSYDFISASLSLQFLNNQDSVYHVIDHMKLYCADGGYIFISVPTKAKVAIDFSYLFENQFELQKHFVDRNILFIKEEESGYSNGKKGTTAYILAQKNKL